MNWWLLTLSRRPRKCTSFFLLLSLSSFFIFPLSEVHEVSDKRTRTHLFCSVNHMARFMVLDGLKAKAAVHPDLPSLFIVNTQLPDGEPAMFNAADDGPSRSAIFIFALKPETVETLLSSSISMANNDIKGRTATTSKPLPPALSLLCEYVKRAPTDADFRGRFKVIASCKNMETLNLPGFITNYNGKPVLITKSGTLHQGEGYMEMDINVNRFSYVAKKGLNYLKTRFQSMTFDVGFVIEGRVDEELPEQMLGAAKLHRLDYNKAATGLFGEGGRIRGVS